MRYFRSALLAAAAAIVFVPAAMAQPRPAQIVGTIPTRIATYHAGIVALAPAASATDFFTLTGSATMVVRVKSVECSGISTANATNTIVAVRRTSADLTGTATNPPATPSDTNDVAATAVVAAYTANPGTLGTLTANAVVRTGKLTTGTAASSTVDVVPTLAWTFGNLNDKEIVLRGVGQVFALNAAATSFSAGAALNCDIEWTESGS